MTAVMGLIPTNEIGTFIAYWYVEVVLNLEWEIHIDFCNRGIY